MEPEQVLELIRSAHGRDLRYLPRTGPPGPHGGGDGGVGGTRGGAP
jgi:hypothetical protein